MVCYNHKIKIYPLKQFHLCYLIGQLYYNFHGFTLIFVRAVQAVLHGCISLCIMRPSGSGAGRAPSSNDLVITEGGLNKMDSVRETTNAFS